MGPGWVNEVLRHGGGRRVGFLHVSNWTGYSHRIAVRFQGKLLRCRPLARVPDTIEQKGNGTEGNEVNE